MKIIALDIGGTSIKACIADKEGNIDKYKEYDTEGAKGVKVLIEKLIEIIKEYDNFDCIGISTAGQVDSEKGYIVYANEDLPGYTGTKLKEILEKEFNKPVKIENDVNAATLGEKQFGSAKGIRDFLCITYGTGVEGAIVIDSKLYKGNNGVAAEFGHIITHRFKDKYHKGYYERYASTSALIEMAENVSPEFSNGKIVYREFEKGNQTIVRLVEDWIFEVALGLVSIIHSFNPSTVVLGGGIMEQEEIVNMVSKSAKSMIKDSFADVNITTASLGNKAGLLGAASLYI